MAIMMPRESWTDERLDDLNTKVDKGFDRMDARFDRMDARFDRMDARFEALQRTLLQCAVALVVALLGLIATQL